MTLPDERPLPGCITTTVGLVAWLLLAGLLASSVARCQDRVSLLMRTGWSECGVECEPEELAALNHVIVNYSLTHGVTWPSAWAALSPRLAEGTVTRRWLSHLTTRCSEPAFWPRLVIRNGLVGPHPSWGHYEDRCGVLAVYSAWMLSGYIPSPCVTAPRSWGSTSDVIANERLSSRRWVDVDCGERVLRYGGWE